MSGGWNVTHRQVSDHAPLALSPGEEGMDAFFWAGVVPMGHRRLMACELPMSSAAVRETINATIAATLHASMETGPLAVPEGQTTLSAFLGRWSAANPRLVPETSLVICTRHRPSQLDRCLHSVGMLEPTPGEIVVVDNSSGDRETEAIVAKYPKVRYVVEPRPGLSRARNAGIRHTSGTLIAFADDDMVVTINWLQELVGVFENAAIDGACGLVLPAELRTTAQVLFEHNFGGFNRGYVPRLYDSSFLKRDGTSVAPVWDICLGGNMAIRRSVLERHGLFDERLGAGASGCSEDSELWYRLLAGGGVCAYVPTAVVHHFHRAEMNSLGSQIFLYMRGHVAALLVQFAQSGDWRHLYRVFVELPKTTLVTTVDSLLCPRGRKRVMMKSTAGSIAGVWYWLTHSRHKPPQGGLPPSAG